MNTKDESPAIGAPVIALGRPSTQLGNLSDRQFLQCVHWRKSANRELVQAAARGEINAFVQRLWQQFPKPATAGKSSKKNSPAAHNLEAAEYFHVAPSQPLRDLLEKSFAARDTTKPTKSAPQQQHLTAREQQTLDAFLQEIRTRRRKVTLVDLQGLTELLLQTSDVFDGPTFFQLWRATLAAACGFVQEYQGRSDGDPALTADEQLLIEGELPWRLGLLFRDIKGAPKLSKRGKKVIRRELEERTDGDGTPHATLLPHMGYWLAGLIRCGQWANRFGATLWDDDSTIRFNDLLEHSIRLYRPSGHWALSNGFAAPPQTLFEAASQLAGSDFKIGDLSFAWEGQKPPRVNGKSKSKKSTRTRSSKRIQLEPSSQSDWADLACLRNGWEAECDSIVVNYNGEFPQIDFSVLGRTLFRGNWGLAIHVDGKPVEVKPQWTAICWNSDHDSDYLEIQQTFASGGRIERQVWLSRTSHFAILADSLSGFTGERIEYTSRLPLAAGAEQHPDNGDRETRIKCGPTLARVFPLYLPQDRLYSTPGGCGLFRDELVMKQVAGGSGLYAPVLLDWHPDRRRKAVQWRQLTVTEDGRILRGETAAGFRAKLGNQHLLAYRRLRNAGEPHTLLGFQTLDESVIGSFDKHGDVTPLLMVK